MKLGCLELFLLVVTLCLSIEVGVVLSSAGVSLYVSLAGMLAILFLAPTAFRLIALCLLNAYEFVVPEVPRCRRGSCRVRSAYLLRFPFEPFTHWRCGCSDEYVSAEGRMYFIGNDGEPVLHALRVSRFAWHPATSLDEPVPEAVRLVASSLRPRCINGCCGSSDYRVSGWSQRGCYVTCHCGQEFLQSFNKFYHRRGNLYVPFRHFRPHGREWILDTAKATLPCESWATFACASCHKRLQFTNLGFAEDGVGLRCSCGAEYVMKGPLLLRRDAEGSLRPFMRYRWRLLNLRLEPAWTRAST